MRAAPRRFRRRLLLWLWALGLAPLCAAVLLGAVVVRQALELSPSLEPLLERTTLALDRDGALVDDLARARLHLAQAALGRKALLERVPLVLAAGLLLSAGLLAGAAAVAGRRVARPLSRLTEGMERLGRGDAHVPLAAPEDEPVDELDYALRGFDRMSAELAAQRARLAASERLAAWQDVARTMAHELRNPLTAMKMSLARLSRPGRTEAAVEDAAQLLTEEMDVLLRMTESFSAFARLPAPSPRALLLAPVLREVASLYGPSAVTAVVVHADEVLGVNADPDQLRRALGNLIKNALEASRAGDGPVEVAAHADDGWVHITVSDHGVGIAEVREGEAFVRALGSTKPGGSGLGLAVTHKIAHDHGGMLRLSPREGGGTVALLQWPAARQTVVES